MLSKVASSTNFWIFGMTRPGIELESLGPLVNTLLIRPMVDLAAKEMYLYKINQKIFSFVQN